MAGIIEHGRDEIVWLLETGFVYLEMGDPLAARETFEGLVALEPGTAAFQAALGQAYCAEGNLSEARKVLRRASELDPKQAYVRCLLGEALIRSKQTDPGKEELRRAIQLEPDGPAGSTARTILEGVEAGLYPPPPGQELPRGGPTG
jgi:predicted Zn-dependent protease